MLWQHVFCTIGYGKVLVVEPRLCEVIDVQDREILGSGITRFNGPHDKTLFIAGGFHHITN